MKSPLFHPPPDARIDVPWGHRQVAIGIGIAAAVSATVLLALTIAYRSEGAPLAAVIAGTLVLELALAATAARLGPRDLGSLVLLFVPRQLGTLSNFGWAALALAGSIGLGAIYVAIVSRISDSLQPSPLPIDLTTSDQRWFAFFVVVLIGPFCEELFFRGFVFAGLLRRYGPTIATISSAAVFGLAHLDLAIAGPAFLSGCVFALTYRRTGSLWPTVLAHTAQNAIAFALAGST